MTYIKEFFSELVYLTVEMAPYLIFGFIIAGLLYAFFPKHKVQRYMGGNSLKSVIVSALIGVPLPLCSCGVIPTGISFHQNGASKGAAVSFLISTPQTGVDSILVTYSLLGLPFALIRPIIAFVTGIFGGALTNRLVKKANDTEGTITVKSEDTVKGSFVTKTIAMFRYAFVDFLQDIMKWMVIGLALAALMAVIIPDDFFTQYIGNEYLSMLIVLVASIPLYVCATGSVPIAAVLLLKGLSPGAALVFLMAGPATNAATITVIGKALGKRSLIAYLASIISGAILFGTIINEFLPAEWFALAGKAGAHAHSHEVMPYWVKVASGIALTLLIVNGYLMKYKIIRFKRKSVTDDGSGKTISVRGMNCNHCRMSVETNLKKIKGIKDVKVDLNSETATIDGDDYSMDKVISTIKDLGFKTDDPKH